MGVGSKHQFISQSSKLRRCLNRAVVESKRRPVEILKIERIVLEAFELDNNLHQNIILNIEKLAKTKEGEKSAANLCIGSIRAIGHHDLVAALNLGYSSIRRVLDYRIYRAMIEYHCRLKHYNAAMVLLDYIEQDDWTHQKRKDMSPLLTLDEGSRESIIFQRLAESLMHSTVYGKGGETPSWVKEKEIVFPPFQMPIVAWEKRSLLYRMISRDIHLKYQKSILGWVWAIIEPLALTLTFLLLFEILSSKTDQYMPLNIMIGVMIWSSFGFILIRGTKFFESNVATLQRVSIPRHIFILNITGTSVTTLCLNMLAIVPLLFYYDLMPTIRILYLPLALLLMSIYGIGITLFTSTLQTRLRDISQIVGVAVRVGFYFTPVFFTLDMLATSRIPSEYLNTYLLFNPMATYLTMARSAFTGQPLGISTEYVLYSVLHAIIIYILASFWFSKKQDMAVKYL